MEILQTIHGHTRWLVVLAVVVASVYMVYGALAQKAYDKLAYRVMTAFSSVIGLQWVLGLLVFVLLFANTRERWEHAFMNTVALAIAHAHFSMKKKVDATTPQPKLYWRALLIIGLTMGVVFVGVALLPGNGWNR